MQLLQISFFQIFKDILICDFFVSVRDKAKMTEGNEREEEMKAELLKIVTGQMLEEALSKWLVRFGNDNDDFAVHALKSMDEDDWRDNGGFREQRTKGKQARYSSMQTKFLVT